MAISSIALLVDLMLRMPFFTNSGSRDDINSIARRHTRAGKPQKGQFMRHYAAMGGWTFLSVSTSGCGDRQSVEAQYIGASQNRWIGEKRAQKVR